ncbi:MAG TPA: hypothetical protein VJI33_02565 [Candidatus Paceibacterota bacterium]
MGFFKSIIYKIKSIRRVDICGERNFYRDWVFVVAIGLLIISVIFVALWYLGSAIINDPVSVKTSNRTVLTINRSLLNEVVNFYKDQNKLFQETKTEPPAVSDPSR